MQFQQSASRGSGELQCRLRGPGEERVEETWRRWRRIKVMRKWGHRSSPQVDMMVTPATQTGRTTAVLLPFLCSRRFTSVKVRLWNSVSFIQQSVFLQTGGSGLWCKTLCNTSFTRIAAKQGAFREFVLFALTEAKHDIKCLCEWPSVILLFNARICTKWCMCHTLKGHYKLTSLFVACLNLRMLTNMLASWNNEEMQDWGWQMSALIN